MRSSRKFLAVVLLVILAATLLTAFALADGAQAAEAPARSITCTTCVGKYLRMSPSQRATLGA